MRRTRTRTPRLNERRRRRCPPSNRTRQPQRRQDIGEPLPEKHEHEYQSIDDLRRGSQGRRAAATQRRGRPSTPTATGTNRENRLDAARIALAGVQSLEGRTARPPRPPRRARGRAWRGNTSPGGRRCSGAADLVAVLATYHRPRRGGRGVEVRRGGPRARPPRRRDRGAPLHGRVPANASPAVAAACFRARLAGELSPAGNPPPARVRAGYRLRARTARRRDPGTPFHGRDAEERG